MCTHPPVRVPINWAILPAHSLADRVRRRLRRSTVPMQAFSVAFAYTRSEAQVTYSSDPRPAVQVGD